MANRDNAVCTPADKAKISIAKEGDVKIVDFTKSSTACLETYANKVSRTQLLLVADGDYQAWRNVNIETAKQLRQEGKPTNVFFTGETDGKDNTAMTVLWANGVERGFHPVKMKNGSKIFEIAAIQDVAISSLKTEAQSVWNKYLKRPEYTDSEKKESSQP